MFLIFTSLICFDLGLTGLIAGFALLAISLLNLYALVQYPEYIQPPAVSDARKAQMSNQATSAAMRGAGGAYNAPSSV
jgi:hypothetical protein